MKRELNMWRYLLDLYTKFQIDISYDVEKNLENFEKPKHAKIIAKIPKIRFSQKNGTYVG